MMIDDALAESVINTAIAFFGEGEQITRFEVMSNCANKDTTTVTTKVYPSAQGGEIELIHLSHSIDDLFAIYRNGGLDLAALDWSPFPVRSGIKIVHGLENARRSTQNGGGRQW